jgi:hypothetical protein
MPQDVSIEIKIAWHAIKTTTKLVDIEVLLRSKVLLCLKCGEV